MNRIDKKLLKIILEFFGGEEMSTKNEQLAFYVDPYIDSVEHIFSVEELEEILVNEQKFFVEVAETWLRRYHKMKFTANTTHVPSITSTWSNVPPSFTGTTNSKVEAYALKRITAQEWMDTFHEALECMDEEYQDIITAKYLKSRRPKNDDYVYDTIGMSRATYYRIKKQALEDLGRILHADMYEAYKNAKEG